MCPTSLCDPQVTFCIVWNVDLRFYGCFETPIWCVKLYYFVIWTPPPHPTPGSGFAFRRPLGSSVTTPIISVSSRKPGEIEREMENGVIRCHNLAGGGWYSNCTMSMRRFCSISAATHVEIYPRDLLAFCADGTIDVTRYSLSHEIVQLRLMTP